MLITATNSCKEDATIIKKEVDITWSNPADIIYGTPLNNTQLNATANVAGTFDYSPAVGTILSVGDDQNLSVDFTPTDDDQYNAATKTVIINVIKKDPIITWSNPADITLPTALSSIQLNATANIPGIFTYTPIIGTVLSIGNAQSLKVDFTPTDAVNYNVATKTVIINIKGSGTVTDYDGNVYNTLQIGTQTWMVEDLKVTHYRNGDPITNVTDSLAWLDLTTGAYCWYRNVVNYKDTYGALYNWYAVTDTRNIAPTGWHIPTDPEWTILITYLGGENIAGGKMKEVGLSHWIEPNIGAENSSGFTALPGGYRFYNFGQYSHRGDYSVWWSSSTSDSNNDPDRALSRDINTNNANALRSYYRKVTGFSVRCIRD